jgi:hypothetical protein
VCEEEEVQRSLEILEGSSKIGKENESGLLIVFGLKLTNSTPQDTIAAKQIAQPCILASIASVPRSMTVRNILARRPLTFRLSIFSIAFSRTS